MVPVPGFPRVLYPPDHPSGPVVDGPDVVAYKRTVWRAGRWQGPASSFDDSYSNGFAHGKGPNVVDTGVAGVQRQQRKVDDGIVDETTFNTLRSIRVPAGRPHEGEMAMDANAQNLIAQAWQQFQPKEPPKLYTRERALDGAVKYLGYVEDPAGSNHTTFGAWYGVDYQPWCAIFATYCYEVEAGGSRSFERGLSYAYVPYIVADARNGSHGLTVTSSPVAGDLVCYTWGSSGASTEEFDHVGLFEAWTGGRTFTAIEGNTSVDNNSNGGEVMRRSRDVDGQGTVFVRVAE